MSFLTYLCWLLGISVPSDCDANSYQGWVTNSCDTAQEGNVESTKEEGQRDTTRHSQQRTNIDVSI